MSKIFLCHYDHHERFGGKSRWNVNFAEMDTERSAGKNDFDYCEGYLRSILRQNIIMAVLRKAHSHSVVVCR